MVHDEYIPAAWCHNLEQFLAIRTYKTKIQLCEVRKRTIFPTTCKIKSIHFWMPICTSFQLAARQSFILRITMFWATSKVCVYIKSWLVTITFNSTGKCGQKLQFSFNSISKLPVIIRYALQSGYYWILRYTTAHLEQQWIRKL